MPLMTPVDGEQEIIALAHRRSARRSFQDCIRVYELFRPAFGKGHVIFGESSENI
jgi:hypothetical protein